MRITPSQLPRLLPPIVLISLIGYAPSILEAFAGKAKLSLLTTPLQRTLETPLAMKKEKVAKHRIIAEKVSLGEALYFDKRLSADGTVSCAICHDPATAFASKDVLVIGVKNQVGARNVPTLLNARFTASYFWDGRASTLEDQAKQPLLNPAEMGMLTETALVNRVSSIPEYRKQFKQIFSKGHRGSGSQPCVANCWRTG